MTPEELKKGIVMDRRCTDKFMCLVFFVFFCGLFAVAAYGFAKGDPKRLVTPFDSDGKQLRANIGSILLDFPNGYVC